MFLLLVVGCADSALGAKSSDMSEAPESDGSGSATTATSESDTAGSDSVPPAWYALDASLAIVDGAPVSDAAVVALTVVGEDLTTVLCDVPLGVEGVVEGEPDTKAQAQLAVWWRIPVDPLEPSCADLPATLDVGVGELLPDVRAQLGTVGLDGVADALYGAYLRADDGPVWTFGWAGTDSDRAGDSEATLPPPDGQYTLSSLFLVPLPGE